MVDNIIEQNKENFLEEGMTFEAFKKWLKVCRDENFFLALGRGEVTLRDGKEIHFRNSVKPINDADIMYSLIMQKLGFEVPSYIPIKLSSGTMLVRDELSDKVDINDYKTVLNHNVQARDYNEFLDINSVIPKLNHDIYYEKDLIKKYFLKKQLEKINSGDFGHRAVDVVFGKNSADVRGHFTDIALNSLAKIGAVKLAMGVTRNSLTSNIYKVRHFGMVEDVIPAKTGGEVIEPLTFSKKIIFGDKQHYDTLFSTKTLSHSGVINQIKNNDAVQEFFSERDRRVFASDLGDISLPKLAQEYKDRTNYSVDLGYLVTLDVQKNRVCEELSK